MSTHDENLQTSRVGPAGHFPATGPPIVIILVAFRCALRLADFLAVPTIPPLVWKNHFSLSAG
jgi:hypothetical protein